MYYYCKGVLVLLCSPPVITYWCAKTGSSCHDDEDAQLFINGWGTVSELTLESKVVAVHCHEGYIVNMHYIPCWETYIDRMIILILSLFRKTSWACDCDCCFSGVEEIRCVGLNSLHYDISTELTLPICQGCTTCGPRKAGMRPAASSQSVNFGPKVSVVHW